VNSTSRNRMGASALAIAAAGLGLVASLTAAKPSAALNDQNWTETERTAWYRGSQGSRLMPLRWLNALEEKDSATLLMDPAGFARFGYLPAGPGEATTLPLGFAVDIQSDKDLNISRLRWFAGQKDKEPWIGLNCSACHTAEIRYRGSAVRVDGGPGFGDLQSFLHALVGGMKATVNDDAKWSRFAARVLAPQRGSKVADTPANRALLRTEFQRLLKNLADLYSDGTSQAATSTSSVYGHARLDAVSYIFNKVAYIAEAEDQFYGEPFAPVSYPFLWNINQHDFVQWNGIAPNKGVHFPSGETFDLGAMVRNTTEVIGVFADVKVKPNPGLGGFKSSVRTPNLNSMEVQLGRLWSPSWPTAFNDPDETPSEAAARAIRVRDGHNLFREQCAGCHAPLDRKDTRTPIIAQMTPIWGPGSVGTDPWMACNAFTYEALTGKLEGTPGQVFRGDKLERRVFTRVLLTTEAIGTLLGKKWKLIASGLGAAFGFRRPIRVDVTEAVPVREAQKPNGARLADCKAVQAAGDEKQAKLIAYKGRPLNGIWATAPYLHNGSVKSLFEILLPPDRRDKEFWVGNREFDPKYVGYVDVQAPASTLFRVNDERGRPILGNDNGGHDYGSSRLGNDDRVALVEYMKTL
jgi:processive rubber oxygenase RoxA-like protein